MYISPHISSAKIDKRLFVFRFYCQIFGHFYNRDIFYEEFKSDFFFVSVGPASLGYWVKPVKIAFNSSL